MLPNSLPVIRSGDVVRLTGTEAMIGSSARPS
jgi:hypothetical protein